VTSPPARPKPSEAPALTLTGKAPPPPDEPTMAEVILGKVRRGDEVLDKPRTTWLVRGVLPARGWGVGYGPPGSGKSFHTLALAMTLAEGGYWGGVRVEPMRVLYVIAERPAVLADRQEAWVKHHGRSIPANFHEIVWAPQFTNPVDVDTLCEVVRTLGIQFVCIDTLAQCTLGMDENSTMGMSLVIDALNRITAATDAGSVHVVHHTGKDATKGMRGSSALLGAADYTMEVSGDSTAIRVAVQKLNASTKPLPDWFTLEGVRLPPLPGDHEERSGAVLVPTTSRDAGSSRLDELLAAVAESYEDSGITRTDVEGLLGMSRPTANRVLAAGKKEGYLDGVGKGVALRYYLTPKGRDYLAGDEWARLPAT
jgi:hypothetical protein